jgi:S-(hydroxymethyl)glutathione dehydrogenase/alcohol dehydrogenase
MLTQGAILWDVGTAWSVEEIQLDPPRAREVLVEIRAAGLCHTDDHFVQGDMVWPLPVVGGHEGAGVVTGVGPGVTRLRVGDHVVLNFMPVCGDCPSCNRGRSRLCDRGAAMGTGLQISDGTARHHARGRDLHTMCGIATFARHTVVHEDSCTVIPDEIGFEVASLLSCGVPTGWGSAVYTGGVQAGDTVTVVGVGGLGINAVQGARLAGARAIVAVDPVEFKRTSAIEFGATHTAASISEAHPLVAAITHGRMCDVVVMTIGVGDGRLIADALALAGKGGRVVVTNGHPEHETTASISLADLTIMEKSLLGSCFGSASIRSDLPKLIDLYLAGLLELDRLITTTYALEDVNQGYVDMHAGKNLRGVLVM